MRGVGSKATLSLRVMLLLFVMLNVMAAIPHASVLPEAERKSLQPDMTSPEFEASLAELNYVMDEVSDGNWLDAKANGIDLEWIADDGALTFDMPFNFTFYDTEFDTVGVGSNGWLSFWDLTPTTYNNPPFPIDIPEFQYAIAPYFDDLVAQSNVYLWNTTNWFVVQYDTYWTYGGAFLGTFQVVLYPDGMIEFNYLEIFYYGSATIGLNYGDGIAGNSYPDCNLAGVTDFTLRFTNNPGANELEVLLEGPIYAAQGSPQLFTAMIINHGETTQSNIDADIYLEGVVVSYLLIPSLAQGENTTLTYVFAETEIRGFTVSASVEEVPNEFSYSNNYDSLEIFVFDEGTRFMIFQNSPPFGVTATENLLNQIGIPYDVHSSNDMGVVDLSGYTNVIISSVQDSTFYSRVYDNMSWFEDFAAAGGILEIHAYGFDWINDTLPGGATYIPLTVPEPIIAERPSHRFLYYPHLISASELGQTVWAALDNLPALSRTVLSVASGSISIESQYGNGTILYSTQQLEAYAYYSGHLQLVNYFLFTPDVVDHDLDITLEVPSTITFGETCEFNMTIANFGTGLETDVAIAIEIDGVFGWSEMDASIENGTAIEVTVYWTPESTGTYHVSAYVEPVAGEELIDNNMVNRTVLVRPVVGKILWDLNHAGDPPSRYSIAVAELDRLGYIVDVTTESLNGTILADYALLVCAEPYTLYTAIETDAIQEFVSNGGGLFVVGDNNHAALNNLTLFAGIEFTGSPEAGMSTNITQHEVTSNVESVYFGIPMAMLNLTDPAFDLVTIYNNETMVAAATFGAGRVVAIADEDCMDDNDINGEDNFVLVINAFQWLAEGRLYNVISDIQQLPSIVTESDSVLISCEVTDFAGVDIVQLHYRINGGGIWQTLEMSLVSGSTYQATIPAQPGNYLVEYYITATNVLGYQNLDDNDGEYYRYTIVDSTTTTTTTTEPPDLTGGLLLIAALSAIAVTVIIFAFWKLRGVKE